MNHLKLFQQLLIVSVRVSASVQVFCQIGMKYAFVGYFKLNLFQVVKRLKKRRKKAASTHTLSKNKQS